MVPTGLPYHKISNIKHYPISTTPLNNKCTKSKFFQPISPEFSTRTKLRSLKQNSKFY